MNLADLLLDREITDLDISEIKDLQLDNERKEFLQVLNHCDVQACPGAGKTTLVGAKLAILSKKWKSNKQGICILSHTNVAKDEIIKRLEKTTSGSRLLAAPHFIGTIQTFVNQFLAISYMRDVLGWKYQNIDDETAFSKLKSIIWYKLISNEIEDEIKTLISSLYNKIYRSPNKKQTNGRYSQNIKEQFHYILKEDSYKRHFSNQLLEYQTTNLDFNVSYGGVESKSYKGISILKQSLIDQGIYSYNDMFWIARKYLEDFPQIIEIISKRFPLVFIDEMQDTDNVQNPVLEKVFQESVVQRVGDLDQTLSDDCGWEIKEQNKITINGSFRFHQAIADCARTFAGSDLKSKLQGNRLVEQTEELQKPIIILFDLKDKEKVLESFAKILFEKFGDSLWDKEGKQKIIKAVCPRHEKISEDKVKSLKCYHSAYSEAEGELKKKEKHYFDSFFQYCIVAKQLQLQVEDQKLVIQKIQDGLVQALYKASPQKSFEFRKANNEMNNYFKKSESIELRKILLSILQEDNLSSEDNWNIKVQQIQKTFTNSFSLYKVQAGLLVDFFKYKSDLDLSIIETSQDSTQKQAGNIAKLKVSNLKEIEIELSTIHSVKGQTHFATLVLYGIGGKGGRSKLLDIEKNAFTSKLKELAYVALTRPSHFLCLALPSEEFGKNIPNKMNQWEVIDLKKL